MRSRVVTLFAGQLSLIKRVLLVSHFPTLNKTGICKALNANPAGNTGIIHDYLPAVYMEWLSDETRDNFVVTSTRKQSRNEENPVTANLQSTRKMSGLFAFSPNMLSQSTEDVIAFASLSSYTSCGFTFYVGQAVRIRPDMRGRDIAREFGLWWYEYAKFKSVNPIMLSTHRLYAQTYESATSRHHLAKVEKALAGSAMRKVLQVHLSVEFTMTDKLKLMLQQDGTDNNVNVIDNDALYDHLKALNYPGMKLLPEFNGYLLQHHIYPFLINEIFPMVTLVPLKTPSTSLKSKTRTLKSQQTISIGTMSPIGTKGTNWIIIIVRTLSALSTEWADNHRIYCSFPEN